MLELPGLTSTGDVGKDLDNLKRYMARLVPALEMELINARQDGYQEEYNAQTLGVGSSDKHTTAGALVTHELRRDNPHKVTASQLGLTLEKLVALTFAGTAMTARIGEKRGIQVNVQDVEATAQQWTQVGGVAYADVSLGEWQAEMPLMLAVIPVIRAGNSKDFWAGAYTMGSGKNIGTLRIYRGCAIDTSENATNSGTITETVTIPLTMIGWGVYGYGG